MNQHQKHQNSALELIRALLNFCFVCSLYVSNRCTIFVEQVNDNGYEGEDQVEEKELLEDNLVVQVAESHRLENVTFICFSSPTYLKINTCE